MKKMLKILCLVFVLFAVLPFNVFADCSMVPNELKVIITNPDGADIYKYDFRKKEYVLTENRVSYGENVKIYVEYDGYGRILSDDYVENFIKISDYKPVSANAEEITRNVTITNPEGAKLYNYDYNSRKYNLTDKKINYGEKVKIESFGSYKEEYSSLEIDGKEYWIKKSDYIKVDELDYNDESIEYTKYYAYTETKVYSAPSLNSDVVGTIPANSEIEIYKYGAWSIVKYNDIRGWSYSGGCNIDYPITIAEKYDEPLEAYVYIDNKSDLYGYTILGDETTKKKVDLKYQEKVKVFYIVKNGHFFSQYVMINDNEGIWLTNAWLYVKSSSNLLIDYKSAYQPSVIKKYSDLENVDIKLSNLNIYQSKYEFINSESKGFAINIDGELYWTIFYYQHSSALNFSNSDYKKINLSENYSYYDSMNFVQENLFGNIPKGQYRAYLVRSDDIYFLPGYGYIKLNNNDKENTTEIKKVSTREYVNKTLVITSALSLIAGILIFVIYKKGKSEVK